MLLEFIESLIYRFRNFKKVNKRQVDRLVLFRDVVVGLTLFFYYSINAIFFDYLFRKYWLKYISSGRLRRRYVITRYRFKRALKPFILAFIFSISLFICFEIFLKILEYLPIILFFILHFLRALALIVPLLLAVAFFTLVERKVMGSIQRRRGPNIVGFWGLLQPFADGLKLIIKESILPSPSNRILFVMAPIITLILSLLGWAVIPFGLGKVFIDLNFGVLFIFAVSSLGVYGIILAGWSSNSKYAFLGALRSAAQMVSYEVSIGLIVICVIFCSGSLNLTHIVLAQKYIWYCIPLFPICLLFFISALAETNRPPFDLPEAEAELVAGYNVEYSAVGFALFFIGEYANILLMSSLIVLLFFGGWLPPLFFFNLLPPSIWFSLKIFFVIFSFVWVRASFPRYRYDQLMRLGWKVFLPLSLAWVIFISAYLFVFDFYI